MPLANPSAPAPRPAIDLERAFNTFKGKLLSSTPGFREKVFARFSQACEDNVTLESYYIRFLDYFIQYLGGLLERESNSIFDVNRQSVQAIFDTHFKSSLSAENRDLYQKRISDLSTEYLITQQFNTLDSEFSALKKFIESSAGQTDSAKYQRDFKTKFDAFSARLSRLNKQVSSITDSDSNTRRVGSYKHIISCYHADSQNLLASDTIVRADNDVDKFKYIQEKLPSVNTLYDLSLAPFRLRNIPDSFQTRWFTPSISKAYCYAQQLEIAYLQLHSNPDDISAVQQRFSTLLEDFVSACEDAVDTLPDTQNSSFYPDDFIAARVYLLNRSLHLIVESLSSEIFPENPEAFDRFIRVYEKMLAFSDGVARLCPYKPPVATVNTSGDVINDGTDALSNAERYLHSFMHDNRSQLFQLRAGKALLDLANRCATDSAGNVVLKHSDIVAWLPGYKAIIEDFTRHSDWQSHLTDETRYYLACSRFVEAMAEETDQTEFELTKMLIAGVGNCNTTNTGLTTCVSMDDALYHILRYERVGMRIRMLSAFIRRACSADTSTPDMASESSTVADPSFVRYTNNLNTLLDAADVFYAQFLDYARHGRMLNQAMATYRAIPSLPYPAFHGTHPIHTPVVDDNMQQLNTALQLFVDSVFHNPSQSDTARSPLPQLSNVAFYPAEYSYMRLAQALPALAQSNAKDLKTLSKSLIREPITSFLDQAHDIEGLSPFDRFRYITGLRHMSLSIAAFHYLNVKASIPSEERPFLQTHVLAQLKYLQDSYALWNSDDCSQRDRFYYASLYAYTLDLAHQFGCSLPQGIPNGPAVFACLASAEAMLSAHYPDAAQFVVDIIESRVSDKQFRTWSKKHKEKADKDNDDVPLLKRRAALESALHNVFSSDQVLNTESLRFFSNITSSSNNSPTHLQQLTQDLHPKIKANIEQATLLLEPFRDSHPLLHRTYAVLIQFAQLKYDSHANRMEILEGKSRTISVDFEGSYEGITLDESDVDALKTTYPNLYFDYHFERLMLTMRVTEKCCAPGRVQTALQRFDACIPLIEKVLGSCANQASDVFVSRSVPLVHSLLVHFDRIVHSGMKAALEEKDTVAARRFSDGLRDIYDKALCVTKRIADSYNVSPLDPPLYLEGLDSTGTPTQESLTHDLFSARYVTAFETSRDRLNTCSQALTALNAEPFDVDVLQQAFTAAFIAKDDTLGDLAHAVLLLCEHAKQQHSDARPTSLHELLNLFSNDLHTYISDVRKLEGYGALVDFALSDRSKYFEDNNCGALLRSLSLFPGYSTEEPPSTLAEDLRSLESFKQLLASIQCTTLFSNMPITADNTDCNSPDVIHSRMDLLAVYHHILTALDHATALQHPSMQTALSMRLCGILDDTVLDRYGIEEDHPQRAALVAKRQEIADTLNLNGDRVALGPVTPDHVCYRALHILAKLKSLATYGKRSSDTFFPSMSALIRNDVLPIMETLLAQHRAGTLDSNMFVPVCAQFLTHMIHDVYPLYESQGYSEAHLPGLAVFRTMRDLTSYVTTLPAEEVQDNSFTAHHSLSVLYLNEARLHHAFAESNKTTIPVNTILEALRAFSSIQTHNENAMVHAGSQTSMTALNQLLTFHGVQHDRVSDGNTVSLQNFLTVKLQRPFSSSSSALVSLDSLRNSYLLLLKNQDCFIPFISIGKELGGANALLQRSDLPLVKALCTLCGDDSRVMMLEKIVLVLQKYERFCLAIPSIPKNDRSTSPTFQSHVKELVDSILALNDDPQAPYGDRLLASFVDNCLSNLPVDLDNMPEVYYQQVSRAHLNQARKQFRCDYTAGRFAVDVTNTIKNVSNATNVLFHLEQAFASFRKNPFSDTALIPDIELHLLYLSDWFKQSSFFDQSFLEDNPSLSSATSAYQHYRDIALGYYSLDRLHPRSFKAFQHIEKQFVLAISAGALLDKPVSERVELLILLERLVSQHMSMYKDEISKAGLDYVRYLREIRASVDRLGLDGVHSHYLAIHEQIVTVLDQAAAAAAAASPVAASPVPIEAAEARTHRVDEPEPGKKAEPDEEQKTKKKKKRKKKSRHDDHTADAETVEEPAPDPVDEDLPPPSSTPARHFPFGGAASDAEAGVEEAPREEQLASVVDTAQQLALSDAEPDVEARAEEPLRAAVVPPGEGQPASVVDTVPHGELDNEGDWQSVTMKSRRPKAAPVAPADTSSSPQPLEITPVDIRTLGNFKHVHIVLTTSRLNDQIPELNRLLAADDCKPRAVDGTCPPKRFKVLDLVYNKELERIRSTQKRHFSVEKPLIGPRYDDIADSQAALEQHLVFHQYRLNNELEYCKKKKKNITKETLSQQIERVSIRYVERLLETLRSREPVALPAEDRRSKQAPEPAAADLQSKGKATVYSKHKNEVDIGASDALEALLSDRDALRAKLQDITDPDAREALEVRLAMVMSQLDQLQLPAEGAPDSHLSTTDEQAGSSGEVEEKRSSTDEAASTSDAHKSWGAIMSEEEDQAAEADSHDEELPAEPAEEPHQKTPVSQPPSVGHTPARAPSPLPETEKRGSGVGSEGTPEPDAVDAPSPAPSTPRDCAPEGREEEGKKRVDSVVVPTKTTPEPDANANVVDAPSPAPGTSRDCAPEGKEVNGKERVDGVVALTKRRLNIAAPAFSPQQSQPPSAPMMVPAPVSQWAEYMPTPDGRGQAVWKTGHGQVIPVADSHDYPLWQSAMQAQALQQQYYEQQYYQQQQAALLAFPSPQLSQPTAVPQQLIPQRPQVTAPANPHMARLKPFADAAWVMFRPLYADLVKQGDDGPTFSGARNPYKGRRKLDVIHEGNPYRITLDPKHLNIPGHLSFVDCNVVFDPKTRSATISVFDPQSPETSVAFPGYCLTPQREMVR